MSRRTRKLTDAAVSDSRKQNWRGPPHSAQRLVSTFMIIINGVEMDDGVDEPNEIVRDCDDEPTQDNPGHKPCDCEDYPCCGH